MTAYKIVKESKALPEGWELPFVGETLNVEVRTGSFGGYYGGIKVEKGGEEVYTICKEHLTALLELGVVEEIKEWNGRELKYGDSYWAIDSALHAEEESWCGSAIDMWCVVTGNCHPTKIAAENWRDEMLKKYHEISEC